MQMAAILVYKTIKRRPCCVQEEPYGDCIVSDPVSESRECDLIPSFCRKPNLDKLNGPLRGYSIRYRNGGNPGTVSASESSTNKTLQNLKIWTIYFIEIAVYNGDFLGPWSPEKQVRTIEDAPSQPQNLSLSFQEPSGSTRPQMTASWNEPAAQNGIIRRYKLVFSYSFGGNPSTTERITDNQTLSLDVLGGIEYTVELWAETIAPGPNVTETKLVPVYKPSASPDNITSEKMNETTYIIRWNPLTRQLSNGEVIAYEVNQTKLSTSRAARSVSTPSFLLENTTRTFLVLTGLISCSEYIVEVRAYTTAGPGIFGRIPHHIVTSAPGPPTALKTENPQKRKLTLRWSKPSLHGEDVQSYKIMYRGTKNYHSKFKPHTGTQETTSANLFTTVGGLYPGTIYSFIVIAKTHCGYGGNSSVARGSTKIDAPLAPPAPENPPIVEAKGTSVNVTLLPAEQTNGKISGYQLLVHQVNEWADEVLNWETLGSDIYIAAQLTADDVKPSGTVFPVGDGKKYGDHVNKELSNGQKYNIYFRGLASKTQIKKRSTDQNYLFGKPSLIARVEIVQKGEQEGNTDTYACSKPSNTAFLITNILLGVVLVISLGANLYFWRAQRISKTSDRYSASSKELQVTAPQNEGANEEVQSPQDGSYYMELRPTHMQQTTDSLEYGSLMKSRDVTTKDEHVYANAYFHKPPQSDRNGIYEDI